jgi:hypothetical protein
MTKEKIIKRVNNWKSTRLAAMFDIYCSNRSEAIVIQSYLKEAGLVGYITHIGTEIGILLYLNDNKQNTPTI